MLEPKEHNHFMLESSDPWRRTPPHCGAILQYRHTTAEEFMKLQCINY